MLDVKILRDNLEEIKARMVTRGADIHWDEFVSIDRERREALAHIERHA
jgi:seryl-tRNA synthetase